MDTDASDSRELGSGDSDDNPLFDRINQLERKVSLIEAKGRSVLQVVILILILWTSMLVTVSFGIVKRVSNQMNVNSLVANEVFVGNPLKPSGMSLRDENGRPCLVLYDDKRRTRMSIALGKNGLPEIDFYDEQFRRLLNMSARQIDGRNSIAASFGAAHNPRRLELGVASGNLPYILLSDDSGRGRVAIHMEQDGNASVQLVNPDGKRFIRLQSSPDARPSTLDIKGKDGDDLRISK